MCSYPNQKNDASATENVIAADDRGNMRTAAVGGAIVFGLCAVCVGFVARNYFAERQVVQGDCDSVQNVKYFTKDELALAGQAKSGEYREDGEENVLLLGMLGDVFDVSSGKRFYAAGGAYSFFTFKDATRAFLTGIALNNIV